MLTALVVTDKQDFFRRCESAFHTSNTYSRRSSFHLQEAANKLAAMQPEILLIEAVLSDRAAHIFNALSQVDLPRRPAIFLCLEERTPNWEQIFLQRGVMYVFDKAMSEKNIVSCVMHLYTLYRSVEREEEMFPELMRLMRECGFSPRHKGYACIVDSIRLIYQQPEYGQSLTKKVYPYIAKKQGTKPARVEKNIRDAIRHAWEKGNQGAIRECLGMRGDSDKPPSNGKLISTLCERLRETMHEKQRPPIGALL